MKSITCPAIYCPLLLYLALFHFISLSGQKDTLFYETLPINEPVAPAVIINPPSLNFELDACGESTTKALTLTNNGISNIYWEIAIDYNPEALEVLALTYGVDYYEEYQNTLEAINQFYSDYNLTEINTTNPFELEGELQGKNLLLIADQEYGSPEIFSGFNPVLQEFSMNGGFVIFCGTTNYSCITNSGLFNISNVIDVLDSIKVLDNTHPITTGLPQNLLAVNATYGANIQDENTVVLLRDITGNLPVVAHREIGDGWAVYLGFDYYSYDLEISRIIAQTLAFAGSGMIPSWLSIEPTSGIIPPFDFKEVYITTATTWLSGGYYGFVLDFLTSDPETPELFVPVNLNVNYNPCAAFSWNVPGCNGQIYFTDESINPIGSWFWKFGNGSASAQMNPSHTYENSGNYEVKLVVCNSLDCDTCINNVIVPNTYGPQEADCYPETQYTYPGYGICYIGLNTLTNSSGGSISGYEDFTCNGYTTLLHGHLYELIVTTTSEEYVRAWIDFNNSCSFEPEEMIMDGSPAINHSQVFSVSQQSVTGTGIRLRIGSDSYIYTPPLPCTSPYYGQFEDYTVNIDNNTRLNKWEESNINVYPNPTQGKLRISSPEITDDLMISILDLKGKEVSQKTIEIHGVYFNEELDLNSLKPGIYLLKLQMSNTIIVRKLIMIP